MRVLLSLICLLVSSFVVAKGDSYRFEGSARVANITTPLSSSSGSDFTRYGVTLYWQPVSYDSPYPRAVAPFYERVGNASLSISRFEFDDMDVIRGGRILHSKDTDVARFALRAMHKSVPLWAGISFVKADSDFVFSNNETIDASSKAKEIELGLFADETTSVHFRYQPKDEDEGVLKRYGFGIRALRELASNQFEFGMSYDYTEDPFDSSQIQNGIVLNLDVDDTDQQDLSFYGNFFLGKDSYVGLGYSVTDIEGAETKYQSLSLFAETCWIENLCSQVSYLKRISDFDFLQHQNYFEEYFSLSSSIKF